MVHALVDAGERVVVLDNLSTGFDWAVAEDVSLVIGDVGDQPRVAALIAEHRADAIIHFAASVVVPDSGRDPLGYYRNNTVNSRALIESAVKGRVRHSIFSSTAAVYGNPERVPVREDDATVPTSPYGSSKLMTEITLRDAGSAHGLNHLILRYFNVAGADPLGRTGQSTKSATTSSSSRWKPRLACGQKWMSSAPTTRQRTAPASETTFTCPISCARIAMRWRRGGGVSATQLRLRPRFLRARGDRDGKAGLGRRLQGCVRRPAGRGPRTDGGGFRPCPFFAQMAAAFRRPANHRVSRAGMGTQAFDARRLTLRTRRFD
jgi:UDP-glucose 4-epimerase